MIHRNAWHVFIALMIGCSPSDSPEEEGAEGLDGGEIVADAGDASGDANDAGDGFPILWGEPVEAEDDHAYCMKVSKAAENTCNDCVCTHCGPEVVACYFDEGCTWMRECTFAHGCSGWSCLEPCGDVFARYGGKSGPSGPLIEALGSCGQIHCPVCFE